MKHKMLTLMIVSALAVGVGFAQGEKKAATAPATASVTATTPQPGELHGGKLSSTPAGNFETVFAADGIRIYSYTPDKAPAMMEGTSGSVALKIAGKKSQTVALVVEVPADKEPAVYFCPMHADVVQMTPGMCTKCGGMKLYQQNRLFGKADLSQAKPGSVTAEIKIQGLQGKIKEVSYTVTNAPAEAAASGQGKR